MEKKVKNIFQKVFSNPIQNITNYFFNDTCQKFLNNYIDREITAKDLLTAGKQLEFLPLNVKLINEQHLKCAPMLLENAVIEKIQVKMPKIHKIAQDQIEVIISGLQIVLKKNEKLLDKNFLANIFLNQNKSTEEEFEDLKQKIQKEGNAFVDDSDDEEHSENNDTSQQHNHFKNLIKQIISNIVIKIENIQVSILNENMDLEKINQEKVLYSNLKHGKIPQPQNYISFVLRQLSAEIKNCFNEQNQECKEYNIKASNMSVHLLRQEKNSFKFEQNNCPKIPDITDNSTIFVSEKDKEFYILIQELMKQNLLNIKVDVPPVESILGSLQIKILNGFINNQLNFQNKVQEKINAIMFQRNEREKKLNKHNNNNHQKTKVQKEKQETTEEEDDAKSETKGSDESQLKKTPSESFEESNSSVYEDKNDALFMSFTDKANEFFQKSFLKIDQTGQNQEENSKAKPEVDLFESIMSQSQFFEKNKIKEDSDEVKNDEDDDLKFKSFMDVNTFLGDEIKKNGDIQQYYEAIEQENETNQIKNIKLDIEIQKVTLYVFGINKESEKFSMDNEYLQQRTWGFMGNQKWNDKIPTQKHFCFKIKHIQAQVDKNFENIQIGVKQIKMAFVSRINDKNLHQLQYNSEKNSHLCVEIIMQLKNSNTQVTKQNESYSQYCLLNTKRNLKNQCSQEEYSFFQENNNQMLPQSILKNSIDQKRFQKKKMGLIIDLVQEPKIQETQIYVNIAPVYFKINLRMLEELFIIVYPRYIYSELLENTNIYHDLHPEYTPNQQPPTLHHYESDVYQQKMKNQDQEAQQIKIQVIIQNVSLHIDDTSGDNCFCQIIKDNKQQCLGFTLNVENVSLYNNGFNNSILFQNFDLNTFELNEKRDLNAHCHLFDISNIIHMKSGLSSSENDEIRVNYINILTKINTQNFEEQKELDIHTCLEDIEVKVNYKILQQLLLTIEIFKNKIQNVLKAQKTLSQKVQLIEQKYRQKLSHHYDELYKKFHKSQKQYSQDDDNIDCLTVHDNLYDNDIDDLLQENNQALIKLKFNCKSLRLSFEYSDKYINKNPQPEIDDLDLSICGSCSDQQSQFDNYEMDNEESDDAILNKTLDTIKTPLIDFLNHPSEHYAYFNCLNKSKSKQKASIVLQNIMLILNQFIPKGNPQLHHQQSQHSNVSVSINNNGNINNREKQILKQKVLIYIQSLQFIDYQQEVIYVKDKKLDNHQILLYNTFNSNIEEIYQQYKINPCDLNYIICNTIMYYKQGEYTKQLKINVLDIRKMTKKLYKPKLDQDQEISEANFQPEQKQWFSAQFQILQKVCLIDSQQEQYNVYDNKIQQQQMQQHEFSPLSRHSSTPENSRQLTDSSKIPSQYSNHTKEFNMNLNDEEIQSQINLDYQEKQKQQQQQEPMNQTIVKSIIQTGNVGIRFNDFEFRFLRNILDITNGVEDFQNGQKRQKALKQLKKVKSLHKQSYQDDSSSDENEDSFKPKIIPMNNNQQNLKIGMKINQEEDQPQSEKQEFKSLILDVNCTIENIFVDLFPVIVKTDKNNVLKHVVGNTRSLIKLYKINIGVAKNQINSIKTDLISLYTLKFNDQSKFLNQSLIQSDLTELGFTEIVSLKQLSVNFTQQNTNIDIFQKLQLFLQVKIQNIDIKFKKDSLEAYLSHIILVSNLVKLAFTDIMNEYQQRQEEYERNQGRSESKEIMYQNQQKIKKIEKTFSQDKEDEDEELFEYLPVITNDTREFEALLTRDRRNLDNYHYKQHISDKQQQQQQQNEQSNDYNNDSESDQEQEEKFFVVQAIEFHLESLNIQLQEGQDFNFASQEAIREQTITNNEDEEIPIYDMTEEEVSYSLGVQKKIDTEGVNKIEIDPNYFENKRQEQTHPPFRKRQVQQLKKNQVTLTLDLKDLKLIYSKQNILDNESKLGFQTSEQHENNYIKNNFKEDETDKINNYKEKVQRLRDLQSSKQQNLQRISLIVSKLQVDMDIKGKQSYNIVQNKQGQNNFFVLDYIEDIDEPNKPKQISVALTDIGFTGYTELIQFFKYFTDINLDIIQIDQGQQTKETEQKNNQSVQQQQEKQQQQQKQQIPQQQEEEQEKLEEDANIGEITFNYVYIKSFSIFLKVDFYVNVINNAQIKIDEYYLAKHEERLVTLSQIQEEISQQFSMSPLIIEVLQSFYFIRNFANLIKGVGGLIYYPYVSIQSQKGFQKLNFIPGIKQGVENLGYALKEETENMISTLVSVISQIKPKRSHNK